MKRARILTALAEFLEATREAGLRMVISFVDTGGHVLCVWREPGSWLGSLDIATNKAWTAVAFSGVVEGEALPTDKLSEMAQPGADLYGVQETNQGKVVIFPGGIPVYEDGKLVGGIGVSGSSVQNDLKYAQVAVDAYLALAEKENNFISLAQEADEEDEEDEDEDPEVDDEAGESDGADEEDSEDTDAAESDEEDETEDEEEAETAALTDAPADDKPTEPITPTESDKEEK